MGPISTSRNVPYSLSTPHESSSRVPPPSILVRNCIVRSLPMVRRPRRARHHTKLKDLSVIHGTGVARGCPLSTIQADTPVPPSPPGAAPRLCTPPRGLKKRPPAFG